MSTTCTETPPRHHPCAWRTLAWRALVFGGLAMCLPSCDFESCAPQCSLVPLHVEVHRYEWEPGAWSVKLEGDGRDSLACEFVVADGPLVDDRLCHPHQIEIDERRNGVVLFRLPIEYRSLAVSVSLDGQPIGRTSAEPAYRDLPGPCGVWCREAELVVEF